MKQMKPYVICMDVAGDINRGFAAGADVRLLPMDYSIGDKFQTCLGLEKEDVLKPFYDGQRKGDLTKTTQITPFMYSEFFEKIIKEGSDIICFCLSSGLSNTYQSCLLAIEQLKEKYPESHIYAVDTLGATGGMGVEVTQCVQFRKDGLSIDENYKRIVELTHRIHHYFLVDDLNYLKRGGRISATTAFVASLLNFKPILEIDKEGKLLNLDKKRGTKQGLLALESYFEEQYDPEYTKTVYIVHGDNIPGAEALEEAIEAVHKELNIQIEYLTPIIGAHTGPGMVAVLFYGKKW